MGSRTIWSNRAGVAKVEVLESEIGDDQMLYALANLEPDRLKAIQELEKEIGTALIAVSEVSVEKATLADDKLSQLQTLEQKLGVILVAAKPN